MLHQRECQRLSKLQFTRVNGTQMECCPHFKKHRHLFPCEKISGSHRPDLHQKLVASKGGSDIFGGPFFRCFRILRFLAPSFLGLCSGSKLQAWENLELRKHPVSRRAAEPCEKKLGPRLPAFQQLHIRFPGGWIPKGLQDIKM